MLRGDLLRYGIFKQLVDERIKNSLNENRFLMQELYSDIENYFDDCEK